MQVFLRVRKMVARECGRWVGLSTAAGRKPIIFADRSYTSCPVPSLLSRHSFLSFRRAARATRHALELDVRSQCMSRMQFVHGTLLRVLRSPAYVPFVTSTRFRQNTAFPCTGLNTTPSSSSASQLSQSHHRSFCGTSNSGNCVPPPMISEEAYTYTKKLERRLPPNSDVV